MGCFKCGTLHKGATSNICPEMNGIGTDEEIISPTRYSNCTRLLTTFIMDIHK